jgi:hypothetical protein
MTARRNLPTALTMARVAVDQGVESSFFQVHRCKIGD